LVFRVPQVDPDSFAPREPLGGCHKHQAMPAANVENVLAPTPGDEIEQMLAFAELANAAAVEHEKAQTKEISRAKQK
jgi:hypothetical protein